MDLPEKAKASEVSDLSTCATNSRATDWLNSDDDSEGSEGSEAEAATWRNGAVDSARILRYFRYI